MENDSKHHILVVDDDERILKLLEQFLSKNGYLVSKANSAKEAEMHLKKSTFDLMMVDVMMPEVTGIEFVKRIKEQKISVPIILLTALSDPEDKQKGLQSGADDYITKPFDGQDLLSRAQGLIDQYGANDKKQNIVEFGNVSYDFVTHALRKLKDGDQIKLGSTEKKLLETFIRHKGVTLSRAELASIVGAVNERSVDVQVVRLRTKIEADPSNPRFLQTVRNMGYVLHI